jgi:hypothetical protein
MYLRGIIKEELDRQNYAYTLTKKYGDEQLAAHYLNAFCEVVNKLNEHGGHVYRLAFTSDENEVTNETEGTGWVVHKEVLQSKTNQPNICIVRANVLAGSVDMNSTIENYSDYPEDEEVKFVREPKIAKVIKVK